MKTKLVSLLSLSVGLVLTGCGKSEESSAPAAAPTPPAPAAPAPAASTVEKAANTVAAGAQKAAAEVQATTEQAMTRIVKPPEPAATPAAPAAPAQTQTQTILEKAKGLMSQKKYPEALAALSELSSVSLSGEQQKLVDQLKAQIQSAIAAQTTSEGLKSVGGLLPKK